MLFYMEQLRAINDKFGKFIERDSNPESTFLMPNMYPLGHVHH